MPGKGRAEERELTQEECCSMGEGAHDLGLSEGDLKELWGPTTVDVYLNGEAFWSNVPQAVWDYAIGGYQVLKKWLSYRETSVLGRDITKEEAREFTQMVRRIAALLLLEPVLDSNYADVKHNVYTWTA